MSNIIDDLYLKAGIAAVENWGVTPKTQIMHTTASEVVFPGPSMEALRVGLVQFMLPNGAALDWGYCAEADVLVIRSYEG